MNHFPAYMFHKVHGKKLIHSQAEMDALSIEWRDSPALVNEPIPAPPDPPASAPVVADSTGVDPKAAELYALNVSQILAIVRQATDTIALNAALQFEHHNPKGPRKMVLKAINERLVELAPVLKAINERPLDVELAPKVEEVQQ